MWYGNLDTWINLPRLYPPRFYQPRYNLGRFYLRRYYPSGFYPGSLSQKRILVITQFSNKYMTLVTMYYVAIDEFFIIQYRYIYDKLYMDYFSISQQKYITKRES